ncbi:MAG: virulence factor [Gammaproteobacteria bacterium]|nr:virulence factor [Gammaproteobacteria bacterium]
MDAILVRWRDIPAQVIVKKGRARARARLSGRFQNAIDRAAMRAKKRTADAYISEWAREPIKPGADDAAADLQAAADRLAAEIETRYSDERLLALIRNHGLKED